MKTNNVMIDGFCVVLCAIVKRILRGMLAFDRYVIKRYLGVETPFYRIWWREHSKRMQRKLAVEAAQRRAWEV